MLTICGDMFVRNDFTFDNELLLYVLNMLLLTLTNHNNLLPWDKVGKVATIITDSTRAPHGCRHTPAPMLRVGQGSTSNCSSQYLVE